MEINIVLPKPNGNPVLLGVFRECHAFASKLKTHYAVDVKIQEQPTQADAIDPATIDLKEAIAGLPPSPKEAVDPIRPANDIGAL